MTKIVDQNREPVDWDAVAELVKAGIHPDQIGGAYQATIRMADAGGFDNLTAATYVVIVAAWLPHPYDAKQTAKEAPDA